MVVAATAEATPPPTSTRILDRRCKGMMTMMICGETVVRCVLLDKLRVPFLCVLRSIAVGSFLGGGGYGRILREI
jgi:hypothetical protein